MIKGGRELYKLSFPRKRESRPRPCESRELHNNEMKMDSCLHRNDDN